MNLRRYKAFDHEMNQARDYYSRRDFDASFHHLERAHILGQNHVITHVQSHWWMFRLGLARRNSSEVFGQILRMILAVPGSLLKLAPFGNTGGTNVGLFQKMQPPEDLREFLS